MLQGVILEKVTQNEQHASNTNKFTIRCNPQKIWSEWTDSNRRPTAPKGHVFSIKSMAMCYFWVLETS